MPYPPKNNWGMSPQDDEEFDPSQGDPTQTYVPQPTPAEQKKREMLQQYITDQYQKKQAGLDGDISKAKENANYGGYIDIGGKFLADISNAQKQPKLFANRLQDLGKVHQTTTPDKTEWQSVQPMFDKQVANARQAKADSFTNMEQGLKTKQYGQAESGMDAGSDVSKKAQMLAKAGLMSKATEAAAAGDMEGAAALKAMDVSGMSASEAKDFYDGLKGTDYKDVLSSITSAANRASQAADRTAMRDQTRALREQTIAIQAGKDAEKKSEKMEQLRIGELGYAQTPEDAKQLKSAVESKQQFDNRLDELISLREKHHGGALLNREDVGRAQQLSKDLLLQYKDMAKLGVLSVSDENILNAIIPSDPLQYSSPLAGLQGQDPTLFKLKKFKQDAAIDFDSKLSNRLRREGGPTAPTPAPASTTKPSWAK